MSAHKFSLVVAVSILGSFPVGRAAADPPAHAQSHNPHEQGRHDNGLHRGWDRQRFNGYTYRGEWHYGPPPSNLADFVELGYRAWQRGERLPDYYLDSLSVVDYRSYELEPPPQGYHYLRDDKGDYLLVGIATGVISQIVLGR